LFTLNPDKCSVRDEALTESRVLGNGPAGRTCRTHCRRW